MVQLAKTSPEKSKLERTLVLVAKSENEVAIAESEIAPLSTPMLYLTIVTISQDVPATPLTAKILLLLTSTPTYDRTATLATLEAQLSSANHSQHTKKSLHLLKFFQMLLKSRWIYL